MSKQYAEPATYEAKLERVMTRLEVDDYDYDWSRFDCWVQFVYKGQSFRFEHSVDNAKSHGINVKYGSDIFAQVVLALEDLARIVERGIYDLSTWVSGMKYLPEAKSIPDCFKKMMFDEIPSKEELKMRYRNLCKTAHPDAGGNEEQFMVLKAAFEEAEKIVEPSICRSWL